MKLINIAILCFLTSCMSSDPLGVSVNVNIEQAASQKQGRAYLDSYQAAIQANKLVRDLTDEEIEEAQNMPGKAYSDSVWTAENPDRCEIGAAVFETEDGEIIYIDDDGEVYSS